MLSVPRAYLVNEATWVDEDSASQGVDVQCEVEVGHEELREEQNTRQVSRDPVMELGGLSGGA